MNPCCDNPRLSNESTACAEIAGDCYQSCWIECLNCGQETESLETINGQPYSVWETLKTLDLSPRVV